MLAAFVEESGGAVTKEAILPYAATGLPEARMDAIVRALGTRRASPPQVHSGGAPQLPVWLRHALAAGLHDPGD